MHPTNVSIWRKINVAAGSVLFLVGAINVIKYVSDYDLLATYGKGFVWGNGILLLVGFLMIYMGFKKRIS
jgi:multisubunit Na+/H+ antiporter MnhG subunit